MSTPIKQYEFLKYFTCLGKDCADTCCYGWGMQVDSKQQALYKEKAPELLDAIDTKELMMKRDPDTDYCVKFSGGLCGIQNKYGTDFLGDACHFYPRATRRISDEMIMTAALSCPEIARLSLLTDIPFELEDATLDRELNTVINIVPADMTAEQTKRVMMQFQQLAADPNLSAEQVMVRLLTVARSLGNIDRASWADATDYLIPGAEGRMAASDPNIADPYCLLYALALLVVSASKVKRPRLDQTIATMEKAIDCTILWETREITVGEEGYGHYLAQKKRWSLQAEEALAPLLRRWVQAQLAISAFPFGGFAVNLWERMIVFSVRFATVKLALMCHVKEDGTPPDEETIIRVIQSLSRFLDHLSDAELSLLIYKDRGWTSEGRLRALIEG